MQLFELPDTERQHEENNYRRNIDDRTDAGNTGPVFRMQQGSGEHLKHCAEDQTRGRRTQTVKAVLDQRRVAELIERTRHQNDDDDRRQHKRAGRCDGTGNAGCVEACIGRGVDTERAGRRLGHRDHVHQVAWCEPRVAQRDLLEKRQGRQSAADGEQTGLEKFEKQQ